MSGLKEALAFQPGDYWYTPDPYPVGEHLFDSGDEINATAPGDVSEPFSLTASGVAPLVATFPTTLVIEDGVDMEITWTPANDGRIQLALLVGWHGAPFEAMLLCETEDDGSLIIPGGLITQFPQASSMMEQHSSRLVRFDRGVVQSSAGPLELFVGSQVTITQISHQ